MHGWGGGGGWVEKNRSMSIQNANDDNMSNLSDRVGYFLASSTNSQVWFSVIVVLGTIEMSNACSMSYYLGASPRFGRGWSILMGIFKGAGFLPPNFQIFFLKSEGKEVKRK